MKEPLPLLIVTLTVNPPVSFMTTLTVSFNPTPFSSVRVTLIVIFSPGEKVALGPIIVIVFNGSTVTLAVEVWLVKL